MAKSPARRARPRSTWAAQGMEMSAGTSLGRLGLQPFGARLFICSIKVLRYGVTLGLPDSMSRQAIAAIALLSALAFAGTARAAMIGQDGSDARADRAAASIDAEIQRLDGRDKWQRRLCARRSRDRAERGNHGQHREDRVGRAACLAAPTALSAQGSDAQADRVESQFDQSPPRPRQRRWSRSTALPRRRARSSSSPCSRSAGPTMRAMPKTTAKAPCTARPRWSCAPATPPAG